MTTSSKKTPLAIACILIAAIVVGGGCWLHRQQREVAWSVLLDTLGKTKDDLQYTEDSYSLVSQTLAIKNLKVHSDNEKSTPPVPADTTVANDATPGRIFLQAASLTLKGAGYSGQQGETVCVPRFETLEMENLSLYPQSENAVTADSLSVGPVTGKLALLKNCVAPKPDTDYSELEKNLDAFSVRKLRLSGVKVHYSPTSGSVPPFTLSIAEVTQEHFSMKDSGPLLAKDLHWETTPAATALPQERQVFFSSLKAETLELDRLWVSDPKAALPFEYHAASSEKLAWLKNFYSTGQVGASELRLRGIQVVYALFGFQVKGVDFSFTQKDGKIDLTGAVNDLSFGRMVNHILLGQIPALKAIPDAANLPLSLSCNFTANQSYGPGADATSSILFRFSDIVDLRVNMEIDSQRGDAEIDKLRKAWLDGENPYLASFQVGFYGEQLIKSITYTITDHKFTDYMYKVLAAKAGTTPEQEKERILARLEQSATHPELGDFLSQPALIDFFTRPGTLQVRLTAKNGPVPFSWSRQDEFSLFQFSITSTYTPRGSETP